MPQVPVALPTPNNDTEVRLKTIDLLRLLYQSSTGAGDFSWISQEDQEQAARLVVEIAVRIGVIGDPASTGIIDFYQRR